MKSSSNSNQIRFPICSFRINAFGFSLIEMLTLGFVFEPHSLTSYNDSSQTEEALHIQGNIFKMVTDQ